MTKILFAGSRIDCVTQVAGVISGVTAGNFGGTFDTNYTDGGITTSNGTAQGYFSDPAAAPLLVPYAVQAGSTVYFHATYGWPDGFNHYYVSQSVTLIDSDGVPCFTLISSGQLQYNTNIAGGVNGVTWMNVGTVYGIPGQYHGFADIDIKLDIGTNGTHTVLLAYGGIAAVGPISFNSTMTNIASFQLSSPSSGQVGSDCWAEILCTENISTVGCHVATCRPTGAGAHSDWSGDYTDVNETGIDDTTVNQSTVSNQAQSYPVTNITVPTGYVIGGVFNWIRTKNDGNVPSNIACLIRTSAGVDHISGNLNGILVTIVGVGARYDVNPDTGQPWTQADWNVPVQLGFVSKD